MRWRLAEVPFGLDYPYWVDDPDFDLDFHVRELALPAPGTDEKLAEQVARIVARPLDRARPLWELYLIHGLEHGLRRDAHQDPPRGDRRALGRRDHGRALRPRAAGARAAERAGWGGDGEPSELEMLARGMLGLPRYPLRIAARAARRAAEPRRDGVRRGTRRRDGGPGVRARAPRRPRPARGRRARARQPAPAADLVQRTRLAAPAVRLRPALARRGQGGQEPLRLHGQRRRRRDLRRGRAPLAGRATASCPPSPLVAQIPVSVRSERPAGHLRQPDHADERPDLHQRARPGRAPAADARGAGVDEAAPPRDAGRAAADANHFIPPAVFARAARATFTPRLVEPRAAELEPRDLERARAAVPALLRRAPSWSPTIRSR